MVASYNIHNTRENTCMQLSEYHQERLVMLEARATPPSPSFQALGTPQRAFYTNRIKCLPPCNTSKADNKLVQLDVCISISVIGWLLRSSPFSYQLVQQDTQAALYAVPGKVLFVLQARRKYKTEKLEVNSVLTLTGRYVLQMPVILVGFFFYF